MQRGSVTGGGGAWGGGGGGGGGAGYSYTKVVAVDFISLCTRLYICAKQVGSDSCFCPAVTFERFAATQHFSTTTTAATVARRWGPGAKCVTNQTSVPAEHLPSLQSTPPPPPPTPPSCPHPHSKTPAVSAITDVEEEPIAWLPSSRPISARDPPPGPRS